MNINIKILDLENNQKDINVSSKRIN